MKRGRFRAHSAVLAFLTLLFFLRVLGQALVVFFSVSWLPSTEQWASGLIPYPTLLATQVVLLTRLRGFAGERSSKWLKNQHEDLKGLHYRAVAEVA